MATRLLGRLHLGTPPQAASRLVRQTKQYQQRLPTPAQLDAFPGKNIGSNDIWTVISVCTLVGPMFVFQPSSRRKSKGTQGLVA